MTTKHKHRIVPGHRGGEYEDGNVVELSITQHAMWHFAEWQLHGHVGDMVAWKGLAGMISKEEAIRLIQQETCREVGRTNKGKKGTNIGRFGTEKKVAFWNANPELKFERSRKGGSASRGVTGQRANGGRVSAQLINSQLWEDPLHPELGAHHFNRLKAIQRENNLPCSKENRRKAQ